MIVPSGKIPLKYQSTQHDCVPTSFLNALNYLFEIKDIPPEVIQRVFLYSLDTINKKGEHGKGGGTTGLCANFLIQWLNEYSKAGNKNFRLKCEYRSSDNDDTINLGKNSEIVRWIKKDDSVALFRVFINERTHHYILCTKADNDYLYFFDPYYKHKQFSQKERNFYEWIDDEWDHNLKVSRQRIDSYKNERYSLGPKDDREICLIKKKS
jgi:hypothetical protein